MARVRFAVGLNKPLLGAATGRVVRVAVWHSARMTQAMCNGTLLSECGVQCEAEVKVRRNNSWEGVRKLGAELS